MRIIRVSLRTAAARSLGTFLATTRPLQSVLHEVATSKAALALPTRPLALEAPTAITCDRRFTIVPTALTSPVTVRGHIP